jgi:hypothetical protein
MSELLALPNRGFNGFETWYSTGTTQVVWRKPQNASFVMMVVIAAGGGGGAGHTGATGTNRGGGGGGSAGGYFFMLAPAIFVPEALLVSIGEPGAGGVASAGGNAVQTDIFYPDTPSDAFVSVLGGLGGGLGTGAAGGAAGNSGGTNSRKGLPGFVLHGQGGRTAAGAGSATGTGTAASAPTNALTNGGGGGGGVNTSNTGGSGGTSNKPHAWLYWPGPLGGAANTNGIPGWNNPADLMFFTGGSGGGGSGAGTGGRGGDAGIGGGGGGGGGGITGGDGGNGGPAMVCIGWY